MEEEVFAHDVLEDFAKAYKSRFGRHPLGTDKHLGRIQSKLKAGFTPVLLAALFQVATTMKHIDEDKFSLPYLLSEGVFQTLQHHLVRACLPPSATWSDVPTYMQP